MVSQVRWGSIRFVAFRSSMAGQVCYDVFCYSDVSYVGVIYGSWGTLSFVEVGSVDIW